MILRFIGCGSAYNPGFGSTSAYIFIDDCLILFDCGETVFSTVKSEGLLDKASHILVIITHFHSDHTGSLGSLLSYCRFRLGKKAYVLFPDDSVCTLLSVMGATEDLYSYTATVPSFLEGRVKVEPVKVEHDPSISCYGYMVDSARGSFFYSGDAASIPALSLEALKNGTIQELYQDTTYEDGTCQGHGTLARLCDQVSKEYRKNVICMHFDHDFADRIKASGFQMAGER